VRNDDDDGDDGVETMGRGEVVERRRICACERRRWEVGWWLYSRRNELKKGLGKEGGRRGKARNQGAKIGGRKRRATAGKAVFVLFEGGGERDGKGADQTRPQPLIRLGRSSCLEYSEKSRYQQWKL
jgi:hypothetical protein